MSKDQFRRLRLYLTGFVGLAALAHVTWEHFNGGVVSHHLLNRADLPAVSNWWGAVLLPLLAWFLAGRTRRRVALRPGNENAVSNFPLSVIAGFVGALLFGVGLSAAFTNDFQTVASTLFGGMFLLALLLPVYRAECVLGFVLGMTFTFGGVLPTVIGSVIAAISALVHLVVLPGVVHLWGLFGPSRSSAA